jgi:hypothetical protein
VSYGGGDEYGANIHGICIQVNQYVWDMIKILDNNGLYGFHFEAKLGKTKTIVILRHENKELLDKAKYLLKDSHEYSDMVFLTRLKKKKNSKMVWIILWIILFLVLTSWLLFSLYEKKIIFNFDSSSSSIQNQSIGDKSEIHVEEIEIDIEKLKAFKDAFDKEDSPIDAPMMQILEVTTSVISSFVSEEEKAKYSSTALVESFKGKSGIKFILKDGNLSEDFNATVKELNGYAQSFIKDNNVSLALQCYDKALNKPADTLTSDEQIITLMNQGELYEKMAQPLKAKESYREILELSSKLSKENLVKYGLSEAWSLLKVSTVNREEQLLKAEELYKNIILEFKKKLSKDEKLDSSQLAFALNFVANFYLNDKREFFLSIQMRKEALSIYKKLAKKSPKKFTIYYYETLNGLAKTYLEINKLDLARSSYKKALKLISKRHFKNYQDSLAFSYRSLGMLEIEAKKLTKAEAYFGKIFNIYDKISKNTSLYQEKFIERESLFAYLEDKKGNYNLAKRRYRKVILSYKKLNVNKDEKYNLPIARALNRLAFIKISHFKSQYLEAEIELFQSLSFSEKAKEVEKKALKEERAKSYAYLSYLAMLENNKKSAWEYYQSSIE